MPAVLLGEAKPKLEEQHGIHKQSDVSLSNTLHLYILRDQCKV